MIRRILLRFRLVKPTVGEAYALHLINHFAGDDYDA